MKREKKYHFYYTLLHFLMVVGFGNFLSKNNRNAWQRKMIMVNNALVFREWETKKPRKILILLPHCLQVADCPHRLTGGMDNCRRCGRCQMGELLDLAKSRRQDIRVVGGGSLARQAIMTIKPDIVIAIACEKDLFDGIRDVFPLQVYGLLNQRPNGPCFNTKLEMENIIGALDYFGGGINNVL
jgi:hypothetical protein